MCCAGSPDSSCIHLANTKNAIEADTLFRTHALHASSRIKAVLWLNFKHLKFGSQGSQLWEKSASLEMKAEV